MRVLAKFQLFSAAVLPDGSDRVVGVMQRWADKKFERDETGRTSIRASGLPVDFDRVDDTSVCARLAEFSVLEPVKDGHLRTHVKILGSDKGLSFQCVLAVASNGGLRAPDVEIRAPRFVRDVLDLNLAWRIGADGERVFAKCFEVDGSNSDELEALIRAPQRRLPVILVSEVDGETIAGDLHERISSDVCGLAHTCRLTRDASWRLTESFGRDWSCYNGAVRVLWPFRVNRDDPRTHPLWTYDFLMRRAVNERAARDRLRLELIAQLFEASTFVADDPSFSRFAGEKAQRLHEAARAGASQTGDYQAIADLYAAENDQLRAALDAKVREAEILQRNVETLAIALQSERAATVRCAPEEAPPETVADAVRIARTSLAGRLAFAEEIDGQVATLSRAAGPPDKVLRYLRTL